MGTDALPIYGEPDDLAYCVASEVGRAFALGGAGGATFHFIRGLVRGSPSGRLAAGVHAARANAPRVAGALAAVCAVYSSLESAAYLARGREYTFTGGVAAATATFAFEGVRRGGGGPAAARWALHGPASALAVAELYQDMNVRDSEKSLARQKLRHGDQPAPAALRTKPDGSGESGRRQDALLWLMTPSSSASEKSR